MIKWLDINGGLEEWVKDTDTKYDAITKCLDDHKDFYHCPVEEKSR